MFETYETERIFNPFSTPDNEEHVWTNVSMRLQVPWFYISYTVCYDEDDLLLQQTLLASRVEELKDIKNQSNIHIKNIYLVSPDHLNNSEHWRMEPIKKILTGLEPEYKQPRYIYILQNGNRYFDSKFCKNEADLKSLEVLYEQ